jgi:hypothetical protein
LEIYEPCAVKVVDRQKETASCRSVLFKIFSRVPPVQYKTYAYHYVVQVLMPTFRILVFQDVSLVGRLEVLKPANQQNSSHMETSNFAVAIFVNLM